MNIIEYRNLDEKVKGPIEDNFASKGSIADDLGRQILDKYGYKPVKAPNLKNRFIQRGSRLYDGLVYGIDDVINFKDIPEDDPLNMKQLKHGRWNYFSYAIDYKSINLHDPNSIYIKLMSYKHIKHYLEPYKNDDGVLIDPVAINMERDQKQWNNARKRSKNYIKSLMVTHYGNNQLLSDSNKSDFICYVKYSPSKGLSEGTIPTLEVAHFISADQLRMQVVDILNGILEKCGQDNFIEMKSDFYLNHKIRKAFQIHEETNGDVLDQGLELIKLERGDISLRIPDHLLFDHFKFDECGEIINSSI